MPSIIRDLKLAFKRLVFPGLDLKTRCRYRRLSPWILAGKLATLDAGFGNGALSYAAYLKGNQVVGVTISKSEFDRTSDFFNYLGIPKDRVDLALTNIYDLQDLGRTFDQIICSETLEHISRDAEVVSLFSNLLRPGGRLLLCCPNALHPRHALGRTNDPETGGHVRDGYTLESYGRLLEPTSLHIIDTFGLASPLLVQLDTWLRNVRGHLGDFWAFPLFLLFLPFTYLDYINPAVPFSIVVVAEKILARHQTP